MKGQQLVTLQRSKSTSSSSIKYSNTSIRKIIPSIHHRSSSSFTISSPDHNHHDFTISSSENFLISNSPKTSLSVNFSSLHTHLISKTQIKFSSLFRSFLDLLSTPISTKWLAIFPSYHHRLSITPSLGRKITGTLFGFRRGNVSFAVQLDPGSEPILLLGLAMSTSSLVKEMSSGLVRIALECQKVPGSGSGPGRIKLFQEPKWTMYCNGRKCGGYAMLRSCSELDSFVFKTVRSISVGAGVIPVVDNCGLKGSSDSSEGELLYMRAKFERVVGSRDSEAFYMLNPDGNGGPELSIFLLRI